MFPKFWDECLYTQDMTEPRKYKKRPAPFSIRFTPEERERLEFDSEGMAMGEYIKWRIFHDSNPKRKVRNRRPIKDHVQLAKALALLGHSRIPKHLSTIAKHLENSTLILTPDIERSLVAALEDIHVIRDAITKALGFKVKK